MPKKLIICCDGTWQDGDNGFEKGTIIPWNPMGRLQIPSNVCRISRAIKPIGDRKGNFQDWPQIVYYQAGIGSSGLLADHLVVGGTGAGIGEYIREAYAFLTNNYMPGDQIFLIGFSRGAFIARSVAGLISDMDLLTRTGISNFYDIFHDWECSGYKGYKSILANRMQEFKFNQTQDKSFDFVSYREELRRLNWIHDHEVEIKAVGVWDTVGALGIPINPWLQKVNWPAFIHKYRFFDTKLSNNIQNAFQALALDEHRAPFTPSIWENPLGCPTNLAQTWFPGVHSNIGGSYPDTGIADLSLAWMMSRLAPWLAFEEAYIAKQHAANVKFNEAAAALHDNWEQEHHTATFTSNGTARCTTTSVKNNLMKGSDTCETLSCSRSLNWAAVTIYDSSAGFMMGALVGSKTRTPGGYHELNPTNDQPTKRALYNTNEKIHASVRVRMAEGGVDSHGRWAAYNPPAMEGWELVQGKPGIAKEWICTKDGEFKGRVMAEDEVGVFERELIPGF